MSTITIGGRRIGTGEPCYIIAELSANHGQSIDRALKIIDAAHEAGADAIKLQTYRADTITIDSDKPWFRIGSGTVWEGKRLYDLYGEAYTPWEWHAELKARANKLGMGCFSSPFDPTAVDLLEKLDMPAHKVASFEIVDLPLLRYIAKTGKPVIMSTGMANLAEIDEAVTTLRGAGCRELVLLKCTSAYPAPPDEANLRTIPHMAAAFGVPVGLSDHTMGVSTPIVAVSLGACVIEKHFTMSRADGGPDSSFSLEPAEFRAMVEGVRAAERSLGMVRYQPTERESKSLGFRRSLFIVKDMKKGEKFTDANVRSIRPANGLHTRFLPEVLGRAAAKDIERGTPVAWDLIQG